jgi:hypothetical protein
MAGQIIPPPPPCPPASYHSLPRILLYGCSPFLFSRLCVSPNLNLDEQPCSTSCSGKEVEQENVRSAFSLSNPQQHQIPMDMSRQTSPSRKRRFPSSPQQYMGLLAAVSGGSENFGSGYASPFKKGKHSLKMAMESSPSDGVNSAFNFGVQGPLRANVFRETSVLPSGVVNKRTRQQ